MSAKGATARAEDDLYQYRRCYIRRQEPGIDADPAKLINLSAGPAALSSVQRSLSRDHRLIIGVRAASVVIQTCMPLSAKSELA